MFKGYGNAITSEHFICQTNGVISDSIVQNWTQQALECYKLGSKCENCSITKAGYSFKCQMKQIVETLIETQGLPDEKLIITTAKMQDDIVA